MTRTTALSIAYCTGTGAIVPIPYGFQIESESDLTVTQEDLVGVITSKVLTTDYTVSGVGLVGGGNVTPVVAITTGYKWTIRRIRAITQDTDIRNGGAFLPEVHEDAFDKFNDIDQQQQEELNRCVKYSIGSTVNTTLPSAEEGTILGWVAGVLVNVAAATASLSLNLLSSALDLGDALLTVLQPITGAIARTLHSKLWDEVNAEDFGVSASNSAAANTLALNAAFITCQAAGKTLVLSDIYPVTALTINALHGLSIVSKGGGFIGAATGTYDAVLRITNIVGLTITGELSTTASYNADYTAALWVYSTGASTSRIDLNNIKISGARVAYKFGHVDYPDVQLSEITVTGGYTFGCPTAVEMWGTQTLVNFVGCSGMSADLGANPAGWNALPQNVLVTYGSLALISGGEWLITTLSSGACFSIRPIVSATYSNPWGGVQVSNAALESAAPLVYASNPNAVPTPGVGALQGGFISIVGCVGYHAGNAVTFLETSADFRGRIAVRSSYFYAGAARTLPTVTAGSVNTVVDIDSNAFAPNFISVLYEAGLGGGTQILDGALQGTWTPVPVGLAVSVTATYAGTWTRIGRVWHWTVVITPTGGGTTASTVNVSYFNNAPFIAGAYAPFQVVDSLVTSLGTGLVATGTQLILLPTWAPSLLPIIMSGECIV